MVALNSPTSLEKSDLVPAQLQINRSCPRSSSSSIHSNLLFNLSYYKMKSFFAIAAFAGVALAQSAYIGLPTAGQSLQKGSDVVVQVQRPVSFNSAGPESRLLTSTELPHWVYRDGRCDRHFFLRFKRLSRLGRGYGNHSLQWQI